MADLQEALLSITNKEIEATTAELVKEGALDKIPYIPAPEITRTTLDLIEDGLNLAEMPGYIVGSKDLREAGGWEPGELMELSIGVEVAIAILWRIATRRAALRHPEPESPGDD